MFKHQYLKNSEKSPKCPNWKKNVNPSKRVWRDTVVEQPMALPGTSRKSLQHFLTTWVPSCKEPGSAHEQTCKIYREVLPHPFKQRRDELRKRHFFVSLPLWWGLLISVDSCAEWGCPDILWTIQGAGSDLWHCCNSVSRGWRLHDVMLHSS